MPSEDSSPEQRAESVPLAYTVVRGGVWVALNSYFNVGFGFLMSLVFARILKPEDFGLFSLATFFFSLINLRTKLGVGYAFAQRRELSGALLGTHLTLDASIALANLIIVVIAVPILVALGYDRRIAPVVIALSCGGLIDSITSTAWGTLDRELRFDQTSLVSSLAFPVSYAPAIWLALRGAGHWSLVAQNLTYALLLLVGMWRFAARLPSVRGIRWSFSKPLATELIQFGTVVGLASLAGVLVSQFDNYLIGTFVGLSTLGFYERAYRMAQWPSMLVSNVLSRASFYTYTRLQDDKVRLQKTVSFILWLVTIVALPIALIIFASADDLIRLLYGEKWLPSAIFLRFLVSYSLLRPLIDNVGMLFIATGAPKRATSVAVAQAALLVVFATPLTLLRGAIGTCIGVGIAFSIGIVITYRSLSKVITLSLRELLVGPIVATLAALLVYYLLLIQVDQFVGSVFVRVALKGGVTAIAYLLTMLAVQRDSLIERARYIWRLAIRQNAA